MSYIGSSAAPLPVAFAGQQGQSFNGGTNTFTLSRAVARTLDIDVVVNNVIQNPYDGSYSVNGTTLTTAEAVSAGVGNVYVIYRDAPIGSFAPIDGSVGTSALATGAVTSAKLAAGAARANFGAGAVLQAVSVSSQTGYSNTSASYVSTFSASITPTSATSKILVLVNCSIFCAGNNSGMGLAITRNGSVAWNPSVQDPSGPYGACYIGAASSRMFSSLSYLDSPATTSSVTYGISIAARSGTTVTINPSDSNTGGSTITLLEIAA